MATCTPAAGPLGTSASADGFGGSYRIVLVATYGDRAGSTTSGTLTLLPTPEELIPLTDPVAGDRPIPGASVPFHGTAEIDVGAVGGVVAGDLSSQDPRRPGVLLMELHAQTEGVPPQLILRFGSLANDRSLQRFDGAFFALTVTALDEAGFRGSWASGLTGQQASGHFCAERN